MRWRSSARRLLPYFIACAGGFLVAYLAVFAFVFPSGVLPDDGKVPAVTGLELVDAQRRLGVAGYTPVRGLRRFSTRSPEGTVIGQSPRAGTALARGETVTLDVSAGAQASEVPPVIGASEAQARALIDAAGFTVGEVTRRATAGTPPGTVADADPAPGTRVPLPAAVSLVVSSAVPRVTVPNVVGQPLVNARRLIAAAGLQLGPVAVDSAAVALPNTVLLQDPGAGETASAGGAVRITVAGIR